MIWTLAYLVIGCFMALIDYSAWDGPEILIMVLLWPLFLASWVTLTVVISLRWVKSKL